MARSKKKLGEILAGAGMVSQDDANKAAKAGKKSNKRIGEVLIEEGKAKPEQVAQALAKQFGFEFVDPNAEPFSSQINLDAIDKQLIKKYLVLPMGEANGKLQLIVHDPMNMELMDNLRFRLNKDLDLKIASRSGIKRFLDAKESGTAPVAKQESLVTDSIDRTIDRSVDRSMDKSIDVAGEDSPVVRLVNRILSEAVRMRASDIHVEPMADRVRLRYRIDGVCVERDNLPKRMQNAVLSRLKLMAGVNIAEKRVPQDGRIKLPVDGGEHRLPRVVVPGVPRRERGLPYPAARRGADRPAEPRLRAREPRVVQQDHPQAQRDLPGDGAHGFGQDDDAVLGARRAQPPRPQDHHRRGPGRVQLRRASTSARCATASA
jgi:type IV pilus assembly protein PilB